jgi:hypothetical protein
MVKIIENKEAIYDTDDYDVVLMGVSTHNLIMGNFQGKMVVKYPIVNEVYNSTAYGDLGKLGKRITIDDIGEGKPIISLMFICTYPSRKKDFIDYDAFEKCLKTANAEFKGLRVMSTMIGMSKYDGKGEREKCLEIIRNTCKDIDLTLYDYELISIEEEVIRQRLYFKKLKDEYKNDKEMIQKISEMAKEMRKKTFLPSNKYLTARNREKDEILNI